EGRFGRKGLSSALQKAVQLWLNGAGVGTLLAASVGNDPSLRDVLRLARPTPVSEERRALFGWLTGKPHDAALLPEQVRALIAFRAADEAGQLEILAAHRFRWDLIADAVRSPAVWKAVARQMAAQALRMNLNTLLRHGVFSDPALVDEVAQRLGDADEVRRSGQMPYQYLAAFLNAESILPASIRDGLERAAEAACDAVPAFAGPVLVGVDVSGSMGSSVTGVHGRKTASKVRCVDVAALFAAAVVRRTPGSVVVPFDTQAHAANVTPGEGILALARRLAAYGGGGTDCSTPLRYANRELRSRRFAACVVVSDNMSWAGVASSGTPMMEQWRTFRARSAGAKLVCIDVQPNASTQAPDGDDVLNVGGFSDAVFDVVASWLGGGASFVAEVEATEV
ncbi:MAG: vWA domain-containing protein, partial [Gemmataceae bacterium]